MRKRILFHWAEKKEIDEPVEIHLIDKEQLVHYQDPMNTSKDYKTSSSP